MVNNAVVRHFAPIETLTPAEWEHSLAVNLTAPFHIVRLVLPGMRARGFGRIFNLSSYYGVRGAEARVGYVTTKTALIGLTRAIALETDGTDITCNAICPGTLPTPDIMGRIEKQAAAQSISVEEATKAYLSGRRPAGRFVSSESVGGADRIPLRTRGARHHRRGAAGRWRVDGGLKRRWRGINARCITGIAPGSASICPAPGNNRPAIRTVNQ